MAASASFPSTLLGRVYAIQLGSHGARTSCSPLHVGSRTPSFVPLSSSCPPRSSVIALLRPRNRRESRLAPKRSPPKKKTALDDFMEEEEQDYIEEGEEEESDEEYEEYPELDVLNAFFSKLEKDINNHNSDDDDDGDGDDDEITEEDLVNFEKELTQVLGEVGLDSEEDDSDSEEIDEDDLIQLPVLKTWQMRKLALALKIGRRKASIKQLSEDVGLDRVTVLEYLRNPPASLLLMSDSLPDEPPPQPPAETEISEMASSISTYDDEVEFETEPVESEEKEPEVKQQVRPVQQQPQKRLKRVHMETLEKVYYKTKRPTNETISSIVHVTNLPRKVILKWFEEKREQDGIPQQPVFHHRYQRRSVARRTVSR